MVHAAAHNLAYTKSVTCVNLPCKALNQIFGFILKRKCYNEVNGTDSMERDHLEKL